MRGRAETDTTRVRMRMRTRGMRGRGRRLARLAWLAWRSSAVSGRRRGLAAAGARADSLVRVRAGGHAADSDHAQGHGALALAVVARRAIGQPREAPTSGSGWGTWPPPIPDP